MSNRLEKVQDFKDQEVEFLINGIEVTGYVNYSLVTRGEYSDWDYQDYSETKVEFFDLFKVLVYSEYLDEYVEATITDEMEDQSIREIEKRHKI